MLSAAARDGLQNHTIPTRGRAQQQKKYHMLGAPPSADIRINRHPPMIKSVAPTARSAETSRDMAVSF
jgi:hypothetical protein